MNTFTWSGTWLQRRAQGPGNGEGLESRGPEMTWESQALRRVWGGVLVCDLVMGDVTHAELHFARHLFQDFAGIVF